MDKDLLLKSLEALYPSNGFENQEKAVEWTTKVIPLLRALPNQDYYNTFSNYSPYFCNNFSPDLLTGAYLIMKSQLKTAIEELKLEIGEEKKFEGKYFSANSQLDIQKTVGKILGMVKVKLWVCDAYMDHLIVEELAETNASEVRLLTKEMKDLFKIRLEAAKKQLPDKKIEVRLNQSFHDRYFILDETDVWSIGTSYNTKQEQNQLLCKKSKMIQKELSEILFLYGINRQ